MANHRDSLPEKACSGIPIALFTQSRIDQSAIVINGPLEITPFPMDFQLRFIHIPGSPCLSLSFFPQVVRDQQSKPLFPVSNRFMRKNKAAL